MAAKVQTKTKSKQAVTTQPAKPDKGVRQELQDLVNIVEKSWFDISILLSEVYYSEIYKSWGFDKFGDYALADLGMDYRVSMWRVQVGKSIKELGLTREEIEKLGWTKFKEISYLLNKDMSKDQIHKLLKQAEKLSHADLQEFVKEEKLERQTTHRKVKMNFNFIDEQAQVIEAALEQAKALFNTESPDIALECICVDWMANHDSAKADEVLSKIHLEAGKKEPVKHKPHANKGKKRKK